MQVAGILDLDFYVRIASDCPSIVCAAIVYSHHWHWPSDIVKYGEVFLIDSHTRDLITPCITYR